MCRALSAKRPLIASARRPAPDPRRCTDLAAASASADGRKLGSVTADWLNGAGLVCNIVGVVGIFFYGVPRYQTLEDAGKSRLLLETHDPEAEARTRSAAERGRWALGLLGVGFAFQLSALFV